jgi:hypothetical protein
MFSKIFVALTFASAAFATVFITNPTASTTFQAGKAAAVQWQDDGKAPSLQQFGPAKISIYAGNAQQQTSLQLLNGSVDVSLLGSISFIPDATIGPNSSQYFIRVESLSLKDPTNPAFPALAFSAKFTLSGMNGTFSAAVLSQIQGQSTAPLAAQTNSVPVTNAPATITSNPATTIPLISTSSKASTAPSATKTSGAVAVRVGWAGVALGAFFGVTMF